MWSTWCPSDRSLFDQTPAFIGRYFWIEDGLSEVDHHDRAASEAWNQATGGHSDDSSLLTLFLHAGLDTVAMALCFIIMHLHPFMPHITEELWAMMSYGEAGTLLTTTKFPSEPVLTGFDAATVAQAAGARQAVAGRGAAGGRRRRAGDRRGGAASRRKPSCHKERKSRRAIETLKAPIGARKFSAGRTGPL